MKTSDFDYRLPPEFIAQTPVEPRSRSRLLVLKRSDGSIEHRRFFEITEYLREGDVLVLNNSRVIPARIRGKRAGSGGRVEILLLRRLDMNVWETLSKPARRLREGSVIEVNNGIQSTGVTAEVIESGDNGMKIIRFSDEKPLYEIGEVALPPYIHVPLENPDRYQTIYADSPGSVAAPTAGLHFTRELFNQIEDMGVRCLYTTLHIGLDTFRPVREEDPREHAIHREYGVLGKEVAAELTRAKLEGRRVICVGTTSVRLVETASRAGSSNEILPFEGWVDLFILPGYRFRVADAMITNFHLPRSTLLMLVTSFAGQENIRHAYNEAIASGYRFYSFGDAMLII